MFALVYNHKIIDWMFQKPAKPKPAKTKEAKQLPADAATRHPVSV